MRRSLVVLSVLLVVAGPGCAVGIRQQATGITGEGATLNGKALSTTGGPGSWFIEYAQLPQPATPTTETTPTRTVDFAAGEARPVSESVHGLAPGRAHYFRVCAEDGENPGDPFCSPFQSFRTVGDSVSGRGVDSVVGDLESSISFEIGGGPSGEDLSGFAIQTALSGRSALGTPLCLAVKGNRAVMTLVWDDPALPPYVETRVVEDGGSAGKDRTGAVRGGGNCSNPPDVPLSDLVRGDIAVTDAELAPS